MDDVEKFNFDDIDLNLDKTDTAQNETNSFEQTAEKPSSTSSDNPQMANRPRLRKIKRPKQHNGPIGGAAFGGASQQQNHFGNAGASVANNGLIRASGNQGFSTPQINTDNNPYPAPNYPSPYVEDYPADATSADYPAEGGSDMKKIVIAAVVCLLVGVFLGKAMFSTEQVVRNGLQGVVVNPEVPKGRGRCGVVEKTQGCVLYIMNPQRQELNGRDFYDLASQLTGRQRFVIETGNMRYSSVKIKPGNIAQLNIPPLQ